MKQDYMLISPVRNEEACIEGLLQSVINQTNRPVRWVVVSDNSNDRTAEIVEKYAVGHPFIKLIRVTDDHPRDFASKIHAFNIGYASIRQEKFDFVGNLDGDVTFEPAYYEKMLREFEQDPRLGIGGGIIMEHVHGQFKKQLSSLDHTPGATQLFRRECFAAIGGYPLLRGGGEDSAADIMARMLGWKTRSFDHLLIYHHRRVGSGLGGVLRSRFQAGVTDYHLGKHPLFMLLKSLVRLHEGPCLLGSACRLAGFASACLRREERVLPQEFIRFIRREQMRKLFFI